MKTSSSWMALVVICLAAHSVLAFRAQGKRGDEEVEDKKAKGAVEDFEAMLGLLLSDGNDDKGIRNNFHDVFMSVWSLWESSGRNPTNRLRLRALLGHHSIPIVYRSRLLMFWVSDDCTLLTAEDPITQDGLKNLLSQAEHAKRQLWLGIGQPEKYDLVLMPEKYDLALIGHRGAGATNQASIFPETQRQTGDVPAAYVPENTISSFREGLWQGADGIEFDVYVTKDGHAVVCHDDALSVNEQGGTQRDKDSVQRDMATGSQISAKTLSELKGRSFGHNLQLPTLQELLEVVIMENTQRRKFGLPNVKLNVELKGQGSGAVAVRSLVAARHRMLKEAKGSQRGDPLFSMQDVLLLAGPFGGTWTLLEEALGQLQQDLPGWDRATEGPAISPQLWTDQLWEKKHIGAHMAIVPPDAPQRPAFIDELIKMGTGISSVTKLRLEARRDFMDIPLKDMRNGTDIAPQLWQVIKRLNIGVETFVGGSTMAALEDGTEDAKEIVRWILHMAKETPVRVIVDEPAIFKKKVVEMMRQGDDVPGTTFPPTVAAKDGYGEERLLKLRETVPHTMKGLEGPRSHRTDLWRRAGTVSSSITGSD